MAGKIKSMSQVKQFLQLHKQGKKIKFISRATGMSKNTVKSYLSKLSAMKTDIDELLKIDDPELESRFHSGNPSYKDTRYEKLKTNLETYTKELKMAGVNKYLLWQEYLQSYTGGYRYTQFCHHLNQQLIARSPSMVLSHEPGDKLFVDFAGKKLNYTDKSTGEIIECPVFVACMPYSDYSFAMAVHSQGIENFIYALGCCLEFLGGVPQILVTDNLKSAIVKASNYEPDVTQALEDFCNYYKMAIVPTRVAKPKDKALVENQVKLVYSRVFAKLRNMQFFDILSINQAILEKIICHNRTRMQIKPYCREECFLSNEKPLLQVLPAEKYEIKYYRELKVAKNNHIYLSCDKHYYSVPYQWTGEKVKVIYTRSMVRVYVRGDMVAMHPRDFKPGGYSYKKEHLCSHHQHYLDRSPDYYIDKAMKKSDELFELVKLLFAGGRPAEQNYRTCDGLLSLHKKTVPEVFSKACREAIECKCYSYKFILKIIENIKKGDTIEKNLTPLPVHQNIRGKEYFKQLTINFTDK
jgi:transposase